MALSNYSDISASIAKWLNRAGFSEITDEVEDFILLAHKRIVREVRAPFMETSVSQTVDDTSGEGVLPADYLGAKTLLYTDTSASKTTGLVRAPRYVVENVQSDNQPCKFYEVDNTTVYVGPRPDAADTFIFHYYADPGPISPSTSTNTISDAAPELYLYGALIEAAIFMKDEGTAAVYKGEFQEAKARVEMYSSEHENDGDVMTGRREKPYRELPNTEDRIVEAVRAVLQEQR